MIPLNIDISLWQSFFNILSYIANYFLEIFIVNYFYDKDNIESVIIAVAVSLLFAIFWKWATAPKLEISKDKHWGNKYYTKTFMYYHLNVKNKKTFWCGTRKPAMSCRIEIEAFKVLKNSDVCKVELHKNEDAKFYARWTSHPVPIHEGGRPDNTKIFSQLRHDVYGHEEELIPIVIKYEGDSYCYMFNNESYRYPYGKHLPFRLDRGVFYLMLKAYYKKRPVVHFFKLTNSGTCYKQLKLEELCSYTYFWLLCLRPCKFLKVRKCLNSQKCNERQKPKQIDLPL